MIKEKSIKNYLEKKFGGKIKELTIKELGRGVVGTGYLLSFISKRKKHQLILKNIFAEGLGLDHFSDKARSLLLAHDSYNKMENHVKSRDVLALNKKGSLNSMGDAREFFILMEKSQGKDFFNDFEEIKKMNFLKETHKLKIKILSDFLVKLHKNKNPSIHLYRRKIRDTIGSECLMSVLDIWPEEEYEKFKEEWKEILKMNIEFWEKSRNLDQRTTEIHGDFHPGNLWFDNLKLTILDRSRGMFGEAADDLAAFLINPIFYSVSQTGSFTGPFKEMFDLFWNNYFKQTRDRKMRQIIAPYFAFRVSVICNPSFYPDSFYKNKFVAEETRKRMINFIKNILKDREFSPEKISYYLTKK